MSIKHTLSVLALFTASLTASGCLFSQGSACDATIQGISLDADVFNEASGNIVARGSFEFGDMSGIGGTSLELCDTDELRINGELAREWEDPITNRIYYSVDFSTDEPNDEYEFVFSRDGEDDVVATVTMPPEFEVVGPANQEEVSRADGLTVTWDPADSGRMSIDVDPEYVGEATCLRGTSESVDDSGTYKFLPTDLELDADAEKVDQCRVDVTLQRTGEGSYPSEFDNGSIRATRTHSVEFISVP